LNKCSTADDWILPSETYRYSLDWFAYSVPFEVGVRSALPDHPVFESTGEKVRPRKGYDVAMSLGRGRVDWAPDRPSQKIGVLLTGSDLAAVHEAGFDHQGLLAHVVDVGGQVSRVDFAADVFLPADPDDLYRAWQSGGLNSRARTVSRVSSEVVDEMPERTVYVGSRASERLLRVYSKGLQVGAPFDWTRIELEMKRDFAQMWALRAWYHGIVPVGCEAVRDFCYPEIGWYQSAIAGDGGYLTPVGYRYGDTDRWLVDLVRPVVFRRLCEQFRAGQARLCRLFLLDLREEFLQEVGVSEVDLLRWLRGEEVCHDLGS
jgi:Putative phage replication protein RstA